MPLSSLVALPVPKMDSILETVPPVSGVTCGILSITAMISDSWHKGSGDLSCFVAEESRFSGTSSLPPHSSLGPEQGCVRCGSRLEPVEFGEFIFFGKCFNCSTWIFEDDELFEDLEE